MFKLGKATATREVKGASFAIVDEIGGITGGTEVKELLDETATFVAAEEWAQLQKLTTPVLQNSIQNGLGVNETLKQLDQALRPYDLAFGAARLETIVRTNFNKVFNEGRTQAFKANSEDIAAMQFSAIMDGRTSDICISLDSKVFRKQEIDTFTPPLHFSCRSVLVAVLTGAEFELSTMPRTETLPGGFLRKV